MTDERPSTPDRDEATADACGPKSGEREADGWRSMMADMPRCAEAFMRGGPEAFMRGGPDAFAQCCGPAFLREEAPSTDEPAKAAAGGQSGDAGTAEAGH